MIANSFYLRKTLLIISIFATISLKAQVPFEIRGGAAFSNFHISHTSYDLSSAFIPGIYAGILLKFYLSEKLILTPGAEYAMEGSSITSNNIFFASGKYTVGFINIPLQLRFQNHKGFFVETGPNIGILTSAKLKEENYGTMSATEGFNPLDFGWSLGIGTSLTHKLGIEAHYNLGLANIRTQNDAHFENRSIQVGLFYLFETKKSVIKNTI
jgi:hypothetical protein